jgi:hypothetical protein
MHPAPDATDALQEAQQEGQAGSAGAHLEGGEGFRDVHAARALGCQREAQLQEGGPLLPRRCQQLLPRLQPGRSRLQLRPADASQQAWSSTQPGNSGGSRCVAQLCGTQELSHSAGAQGARRSTPQKSTKRVTRLTPERTCAVSTSNTQQAHPSSDQLVLHRTNHLRVRIPGQVSTTDHRCPP